MLDAEDFKGRIFDPRCGIGTIVSVCRQRGLERCADLIRNILLG
jgi:hypothetical protein